MKNEELHAIAQLAANNIKTAEDLNNFCQVLTKIMVEAALNTEFDDHPNQHRHLSDAPICGLNENIGARRLHTVKKNYLGKVNLLRRIKTQPEKRCYLCRIVDARLKGLSQNEDLAQYVL